MTTPLSWFRLVTWLCDREKEQNITAEDNTLRAEGRLLPIGCSCCVSHAPFLTLFNSLRTPSLFLSCFLSLKWGSVISLVYTYFNTSCLNTFWKYFISNCNWVIWKLIFLFSLLSFNYLKKLGHIKNCKFVKKYTKMFSLVVNCIYSLNFILILKIFNSRIMIFNTQT